MLNLSAVERCGGSRGSNCETIGLKMQRQVFRGEDESPFPKINTVVFQHLFSIASAANFNAVL
mgnify:CR=1 FL=1|jgi:hypothetical protein